MHLARAVSAVRSFARSTSEYRAELLLTLAFLVGWALLTHAAAVLLPAHVPVWEISGGLLLVSLCGWKLIGFTFWIGLYKATRKPRAE
jgi:hypothetical protein